MRTVKGLSSTIGVFLFSEPYSGPAGDVAPAVGARLDPVASRPAAGSLGSEAMPAEQSTGLGPGQAPVTPLTKQRRGPRPLGRLVRAADDRVGKRLEAPGDLAYRGGDVLESLHAPESYSNR
jgi:hypothetical protein